MLGQDVPPSPDPQALSSGSLQHHLREQRTQPQHARRPLISHGRHRPAQSRWCELQALFPPPRPDRGARVAVRQLLSDSVYFFLVLNTIIHWHNGMSSALIVIIRLFYTLTALDMKRNCWMPGYVFHYLTPFSVAPCPCGIWHTSSS